MKKILLIILTGLFLQGCAETLLLSGVAAVVSSEDERSIKTIFDDQSIELKLARRFFSDENIRSKSHINATSYNHKVLLTGEAPNKKTRQKVVNIANKIEGVTQVYNEITITSPVPVKSRTNDSIITATIKAKLFSKDFDPSSVKVITDKTNVYLMGLLTKEDAQDVTTMVKNIEGITQVVKLFEYTN